MQVLPGPDIARALVGRGVGQGRRVALWTVAGMTVGVGAVQLPLLVFGVASLIRSSPLAYEMLRWLGAGHLVRLGVRLLRTAGHPATAAPAARRTSARVAAREGMISNPTNPKMAAFLLAFLPRFLDPAHGSVAGRWLCGCSCSMRCRSSAACACWAPWRRSRAHSAADSRAGRVRSRGGSVSRGR